MPEVCLVTGLRAPPQAKVLGTKSQIPTLWSSGLFELHLWPSGGRDKPYFSSQQLSLSINPLVWALKPQGLEADNALAA